MSASLKSYLIVLLLACGMNAAQARLLTDAEKQSLTETVAAFDAAMREQDFSRVATTIPPRVKEFIAKQANISVDALNAAIVEQMKATMAQVQMESFGMDPAKAEYRELSNGDPYALLPTETVMNVGGEKIVARSETLAVLDGGVWYLVRINDAQQLMILRNVYPEFGTVEFSTGTMEAVK